MALQTTLCLALCVCALLLARPGRLPSLVGGAYAVGSLVGGAHLLYRTVGGSRAILRRLGASWARVLGATILMALPARLVLSLVHDATPGRAGWVLALVASAATGLAVYLGLQLMLRSRELVWLRSGMHAVPATPKEAPA